MFNTLKEKYDNVKMLGKSILADKNGQVGGGALGGLVAVAIGLVVVAITVGFGARVLDQVNDGLTGTALAAVDNGTGGLANLSSYFPTLGTIAAAAAIISFLVGAFAFGRK